MATWEAAHAGDIVLGHDGLTYGVIDVVRGDPRGPVVTMIRHGVVSGPAQPPPGTPIVILEAADVGAEAAAFSMFELAGLDPHVIRETLQ